MRIQTTLIPLAFILFLGAVEPATMPEPPTLQRLANHLASGGQLDINNQEVAALFSQDRHELGEKFHDALMRFVAGDAHRHYWLGIFLTDASYLKGDKADPYVALALFEEGLAICDTHKDDDHAYEAVSLHVVAAIVAQTVGLTDLARHHKAAVESAMKQNEKLGGGFPALGDDDRKIYDAIDVSEQSDRK